MLFNKPKGVVCTNARHEQKKRVIDFLPQVRGRLFTVGRLDLDSEGLIVLTNDGSFALEDPLSGLAAVEAARREQPDVMVLDLKLPQMRGEEVCKAIREDRDKRFAAVPIIMLTGKTSDVDRVIGMVIGASCYITKPFRAEQLVREIRKYAAEGSHVRSD